MIDRMSRYSMVNAGFWQTARMPEIFAHRGFHTTERENTLAAFRAAREIGVTGVELDVRRTSDGQLVVHHDPIAADLVIAESPRSALPSYVPTLSEALTELVGLTVNVELKKLPHAVESADEDTGTFALDVVSMVRATDMTSSVIFSSFDLATCEALKRVAPEIPVGWLLWLEDLSQALPLARERGFDAVNPPFRRVDRESVELARSLSLEVNVWTVNAPADILAMAALGVDRIISDEPALALSLLDSPRFSSGA